MSEPQKELTPEEKTEQIYMFAAQLLGEGASPNVVYKKLIQEGLTKDEATTVIDRLMDAQTEANRQAGRKNMIFGALWCIGGTVITLVTLAAAQGGGSYVVAWGAIIFGGIQFVRGAMQASG